jgi:hypothetical protein
MVQITVNDDLARAISGAGESIIFIDADGHWLGQFTRSDDGPIGMTPEHIAELKRRMAEDDGTRYTLSEVLERLRTLAPEE